MIPSRKPEPEASAREVLIDVERAKIEGTLVIPPGAMGLVLFAHGSGSSRRSPRNQYVAGVLHSERIATLLFDLLTKAEESRDQYTGELRFNISFLAQRLAHATQWAMNHADAASLAISYFGTSTGAAAALVAAAVLPNGITSVVSRGGRPDLAADALASVRVPTLLIVGGNDLPVIGMNQEALAKLGCAEKQLVIVPGATHLFEEPGTLEEVASLATQWFARHFMAANKSPT